MLPAVPLSYGRPSWSGLLRLSLVAVPVKAYPALASTSASHFHQLHAACGPAVNNHPADASAGWGRVGLAVRSRRTEDGAARVAE